MSRNRIALGLALAAFATVSAAQDRRPGYGPDVTLATAKKIAAATIAECQKNGWNVAVAVVDNHGFLVYFERMDNTQTASMDIAVGKARAALGYRAEIPALAHCSSWSPVTPLTPTAPVTLPSTKIGRPPGEPTTPGSVAVAGVLLITSMKTRVGRR